jgi:hypothetical protein
LEAERGAGAAGVGGATLEVTHDGDEWTVAELVAALVGAGIAVRTVEPERADLERIFMEVTDPSAGGGSSAQSGLDPTKGNIP